MPAGITGGTELRYVAGRLRKAAARDLTRELRTSQRDAVKPLQREIKDYALLILPKRGGYAAIMSKAVRVSIGVGIRAGTLTARVHARGKKEARDVVAVNNGILRHPGLGGRKSEKWYTTRVTRGFVDKPVDDLADRILEKSAEGAERVLQSIART